MRLHDDGGTANGGVDTSAVQVFTITVNFVNHAPSFTSGGDQNVNQDSGTHVVPGWASSISPGPGVDEQTQSLNFIVTNNDNPSLFSLQPTISANGTLTYALKPGVVGTANVTVVLHDNGGTANSGVDTSAPLTFAINVQHVNHAPTIVAPLQNQTVNEDAADVVLSLTGVFEDADTAIYGDVLTYSIGSNDNTSLLDASIANGVVTLHLKPNQNGIAHVAVRATDHGAGRNRRRDYGDGPTGQRSAQLYRRAGAIGQRQRGAGHGAQLGDQHQPGTERIRAVGLIRRDQRQSVAVLRATGD